jgi:hypothetical protein
MVHFCGYGREHPAKLAGVLRTANWLYTAPRQTGGGNEPYAVAVRST